MIFRIDKYIKWCVVLVNHIKNYSFIYVSEALVNIFEQVGIYIFFSKMEEIFGTKTKISMNSSEEINFQTYVESAKQRKTPWNIFENFMKELTYSSIVKLKRFNAILLIELTMD